MKSFFSHDSNARNDERILRVRMEHGMEGYGIYFAIIEKLREEKDYTLLKDYNAIAFELRVSSSKVKSVVEDFGLFAFTEDGERFYSESLLGRMNKMDALSKTRAEAGRKGGLAKAANQNAQQELEFSQENPENVANATSEVSNSLANATSEVSNKIKLNKTKENPSNEGEKKAGLSSTDQKPKKPPIEDRIKDFIADVEPYKQKYGWEVVDDFISYWTEHGPKDKLFRKEKQTSFDIKRRIETWVRNNSKWHRPIMDLSKYQINWENVLRWYNGLGLVPLESIAELTDERKMAYISVYDMYQNPDDFKAALVDLKKMVRISYHLKGANKDNWRADFLWLFKMENFTNVKNGKYRDKT